jgi:hypothetical protein
MSTEPIPDTMRRCLSCQEPIHPKAKLCKTCKSYQDWRRHFSFSTVVLSLLVALVSVVSAVGPQIVALLPPCGSDLRIRSYYFSEDTVSLIVENRGNKPGYMGKITAVVYCKGAFFPSDPLADMPVDAEHKAPKWGFMLDLGTSKETSRTIPPRSSREIPFVFHAERLLQAEADFPKRGRYLAGCFWTVLYNESVCIGLTAEVWNYGKKAPTILDVTPPKAQTPFWRGFTTITQTTWQNCEF